MAKFNKPVTLMGRAIVMTGADAVGGDRMIHQIKRCEMGRSCSGREAAGSQSFIVAKKHGNACGAKGSRKVNE